MCGTWYEAFRPVLSPGRFKVEDMESPCLAPVQAANVSYGKPILWSVKSDSQEPRASLGVRGSRSLRCLTLQHGQHRHMGMDIMDMEAPTSCLPTSARVALLSLLARSITVCFRQKQKLS